MPTDSASRRWLGGSLACCVVITEISTNHTGSDPPAWASASSNPALTTLVT